MDDLNKFSNHIRTDSHMKDKRKSALSIKYQSLIVSNTI